MKITKIRAVGPTNVDFPMNYEEVEGPFVLKGTDGLGPVDLDILNDGSTRPQTREITMLVGLQPNWDVGQTPEELRTMLYDLMTPRYGAPMVLQLMDGETVKAYAEGKVKRMVPGIHGPDPEVQIVIGCVGPTKSYFLAPGDPVNQKPTPGGTITINNDGTAPSGFHIGMTFPDPVDQATGVIITDGHTGGQVMKVYRDFVAGDSLYIDTREGQKTVMYKPGVGPGQIPIIESFSPDSDWMKLHRGANQLVINQTFTWPTDGGVTHTPAYLGV